MDVDQAKHRLESYLQDLEGRRSSERLIANTRWIAGHVLDMHDELGFNKVTPKTLRLTTLRFMGVDIMDSASSYGQAMVRSTIARYWSYCNTGQVLAPTVIYPANSPEAFKDVFMDYCDYVDGRGNSPKTKRVMKCLAMQALRYFEQRGFERLRDLDRDTIRSFVKDTFTGKSRKKLNESNRARFFLDWLHANGHIQWSSGELFPYGFGRNVGGKNIPSYYTAEEISRTLAAVDRSTDAGRRDYLVMCLASVYGMRIGDIIDIRMGDIDWAGGRIVKAQKKTGRILSLPLVDQVKEPLLEYLEETRPETDDDHLIVRHIAPFTGYASISTFTKAVTAYMQKAGIDTNGRHHGCHCLRHSTASGLLAEGATVTQVSELLGHSSTDSTRPYLSLDSIVMRKLGLEVPRVKKNNRGAL